MGSSSEITNFDKTADADANKDGVIDWMQKIDLFENVDTDNESKAEEAARIEGVFKKYNTTTGDKDKMKQEVLDAAEFRSFTRCYLNFLDSSKEWTEADVDAKVAELMKDGDKIKGADGLINLWEFKMMFTGKKEFKMRAK